MATAVTFRGSATVEGTVGTYDILATGITALNNTLKVTQNWEEEILKDNHGFDYVWLFRNEHATFDGDVYFVADTAAHAAVPVKTVTPSSGVGTEAGASLSNLGLPMLGPGSLVVISGATLTAFNGHWQVLTGTEASLTNTGAAKYTLKLRKYADGTQTTALATIPT
jgi:hypothetical protein